MTLIKYIAIAALVLFGLILALIGILSVTHDTPVTSVIAEGDKDGPPSVEDPLFPRTIELFTGTHIDPGNSVQILLNGNGTYPQLWKDIASAEHTVTVQMYYSQPGAVADTMAKYLIDRAQHKVRVLLLLDAFGSQPLKREWRDSLKRAGVEVRWLRPLRWYTLQKAAQRSHVRVVVVDGKIGYTGGFGLADYWLGDGHHEDQWRETNVRFEGPTVGALQAAFVAAWAESTGELLTGDVFFPRSSFADVGDVQAGLMHSIPSTGSTPAERFLALSIAGARKTLYISNSYFVPGESFLQLLLAAAKRGVDVRVLTVSDKTDVKTAWYAGRTYYEKLLEGGVKIYEYQPTMFHLKTMVVDGIFSTVGSANFDDRSFHLNEEINLFVYDAEFAGLMKERYRQDLLRCRPYTHAMWKQRPLKKRVTEWLARPFRSEL